MIQESPTDLLQKDKLEKMKLRKFRKQMRSHSTMKAQGDQKHSMEGSVIFENRTEKSNRSSKPMLGKRKPKALPKPLMKVDSQPLLMKK